MAKHNNVNFLQLNREIFNGGYEQLNYRAKWLYTVLSELEHRFTGKKEDFFFRSTRDLVSDTGMNHNTIRKCRKQLEKAGLLETWRMHWINRETGKKSEKSVMAFRVMR